jgi:hypothetical protein
MTHDAAQILGVLLHKDHDLDCLIYAPHVRAQVQFFLETIFDEKTS